MVASTPDLAIRGRQIGNPIPDLQDIDARIVADVEPAAFLYTVVLGQFLGRRQDPERPPACFVFSSWRSVMGLRSCAALLLVLWIPATASAAITLLRTYDGTVFGDEFGYSCVVVGDMDGDGIAEFVIGAPADDTGGENAGRVFIYRGGHPLGDAPSWVITGMPGERLGHALAAALVDDDYVPDLVIGAPGGPKAPSTPAGRVVIAFGGTPLGARPLASLAGTSDGGRFGWSVSGFTRWPSPALAFIVGAPEANTGAGEVHGIARGDPPAAARVFVLHGETSGENLGYAIADAGVTRGFPIGPEFVVGAPEASVGGASAGRLRLFLYDSPQDTVPDMVVNGSAAGARLGHSVTGGEDTNPNFFEPTDEFVAGAPGASSGGIAGAGAAEVFADMSAPFSFNGAVPHAALGSTVRLFETVTGSVLADLAVGESGAVRVYAGQLSSSASPAATLLADEAGDGFGHAISNSGRIEPAFTTHLQFLVGAPYHAGTGRVYVYSDPSPVTGVDSPRGLAGVRFGPPVPNPSGGAVSFAVQLPQTMPARVAVFDLAGREVARLHEGALGPGRSAFKWDPRGGAAPGIYIAVLEADGVRLTWRVALLR
jgi:hypothetical protein